MHGGVKFYRGGAGGARAYLEAGRARCDDYYLVEGTGLATRYVAGTTDALGTRVPRAMETSDIDRLRDLTPLVVGSMDGDTYERWVAGYDVDTGVAKGRLRQDEDALRFLEVTINGPKTWSLAASLHPELADAYDAAQDRAAAEVIGWLAENSTTRVGPRGRQVQVPVEQLEAAVVRHYTSRAGDPHRHLHLQINARVYAAGRWRGIHSVGTVQSIAAVNGIGHAAVACDPQFRQALVDLGYTLDPATGEITDLTAACRGVQRPGRADRPQRRPLRSGLAGRAPRRGALARLWCGPGTAARGLTPAPTRSSPPTGNSSAPGGSRNSPTSGSHPRPTRHRGPGMSAPPLGIPIGAIEP